MALSVSPRALGGPGTTAFLSDREEFGNDASPRARST
jgi:hypothetical protein